MMVVSADFFANIAKFSLLAIAFFILAGFLIERVEFSRGLVNFFNVLINLVDGGSLALSPRREDCSNPMTPRNNDYIGNGRVTALLNLSC
jgi:hypothetical protein